METIRGFPADAQGIIVKVIVKGGPAEAAKLPAGYLAVAIDGERPKTRDAAYRMVRSLPPGKTVRVHYLEAKGGGEKSAGVTLGAWQEG